MQKSVVILVNCYIRYITVPMTHYLFINTTLLSIFHWRFSVIFALFETAEWCMDWYTTLWQKVFEFNHLISVEYEIYYVLIFHSPDLQSGVWIDTPLCRKKYLRFHIKSIWVQSFNFSQCFNQHFLIKNGLKLWC